MKPQIALLLITGIVMISACSKTAPKCSDTESTELVKQIAGEEMTNQLGAEAAKNFSYEVEAIRTTNTNEKTGAQECAADLKFSANGNSHSLPITYTIEMTDKDNQFYVSVLGLK